CHSPKTAQIALENAMKALTLELLELARVLVRFDHIARCIVNANHSNCSTLSYNFELVAACAARRACAACGVFGFARNTAAAFDVFDWLQVRKSDGLFVFSQNGAPSFVVWRF